MYIVHCTLFQRIPLTYNVQCKSTLYIVYSLLYTLGKCILYTVQCTLYSVQSILKNTPLAVQCTMYTVQCTEYCTVRQILTSRRESNAISIRVVIYTVYTLYTVYWILSHNTCFACRTSHAINLPLCCSLHFTAFTVECRVHCTYTVYCTLYTRFARGIT